MSQDRHSFQMSFNMVLQKPNLMQKVHRRHQQKDIITKINILTKSRFGGLVACESENGSSPFLQPTATQRTHQKRQAVQPDIQLARQRGHFRQRPVRLRLSGERGCLELLPDNVTSVHLGVGWQLG